MEPITVPTPSGPAIPPERLEEAARHLARLEAMAAALAAEQEDIPAQLARLRAEGREKTVRFRELMARKLTIASLRLELERNQLW